jgi:hypothetical protein
VEEDGVAEALPYVPMTLRHSASIQTIRATESVHRAIRPVRPAWNPLLRRS